MTGVAIVLVNSEKEVLLQLRDNLDWIPYPDCWAVLGGHMEGRETPLEAIKREIKEEIGCEAKNIRQIQEESYTDGPKISAKIFRGDLNTKVEDMTITEGRGFKFFKLEELDKIKIPTRLKEFIIEKKDSILN
jgi:8-oxo-dGTP diphosphatase